MRTALSCLLMLLPGLALAEDAAPAASPPPAAPAAAAPAPAPDLAKLDAMYDQRESPQVARELEKELAAALEASPNDYGLLWRQARVKFWIADGMGGGDAKMKLGTDVWKLGERAIKANPNGIEGYYWAAIGIGAYSQGAGILRALAEGLEGKFNDRLDRANKMDPSFNRSGGLVAKARYFFELPWPKRDLRQSVEFSKKAIALHPESLRIYVDMAEALLADGKAKEANDTLALAHKGSADYDPPEAHRAQASARKIQAMIDKELKK